MVSVRTCSQLLEATDAARSAAARAALSAEAAAVFCAVGSGAPGCCAAGFGCSLARRGTIGAARSATSERAEPPDDSWALGTLPFQGRKKTAVLTSATAASRQSSRNQRRVRENGMTRSCGGRIAAVKGRPGTLWAELSPGMQKLPLVQFRAISGFRERRIGSHVEFYDVKDGPTVIAPVLFRSQVSNEQMGPVGGCDGSALIRPGLALQSRSRPRCVTRATARLSCLHQKSVQLLYGDRTPAGTEPETDGAHQEVGGQHSAQPVQPV